jgi:hypothetical protein
VRHSDEETLSLVALGEPATAAVEEHLDRCDRCAGDLAALRQVVAAARDTGGGPAGQLDVTAGTPAPPVAPPAAVWDRIAAATGVSVAARPEMVERHAAGSGRVIRPAAGPGGRRPDPRPTRRRRIRRRTALALATASLVVGALAGAAGTWVLSDRSSSTSRSVVVAATPLAGLQLAPQAAGRANVVETAQGRVLDVNVSRLATPEGYYEVWLIDRSVTRMVAVGVLRGDAGRFALPDGVDLSGYPIVDVSVQPLNGDPKHSGRSVLRGTLRS